MTTLTAGVTVVHKKSNHRQQNLDWQSFISLYSMSSTCCIGRPAILTKLHNLSDLTLNPEYMQHVVNNLSRTIDDN